MCLWRQQGTVRHCQNKLAIELRAPKFFWMKVTDLVQIISTFEQLNYNNNWVYLEAK